MNMCETNDHWRDQHNDWKARRERLRVDRLERRQRRDHGLRRRHAAKLAQGTKKPPLPNKKEAAA